MTHGTSHTKFEPRTVAIVAILFALAAIALELAYVVGVFVTGVVHQIP